MERAYKVSMNRPYVTRDYRAVNLVFNAEYPMVRWLEANGYDVSYTTGVDSDRRGELIKNHKVFLSVGHDEYWSGTQRAHVEAARDAGVHLAFFSGNDVFWKIRWEPSTDPSHTPYRTLVTYKETHANAKIDPLQDVWTGTWRDSRPFNPEGPKPENALKGTIFTVNAWRNDPLIVPARFAPLRFWRNTEVAQLKAGQQAVLGYGILGHEWNEDLDNGFRPAGLMRMSETTVNNVPYIQDFGTVYAAGTATHHLTLFRAPSGALVFSAGTVQWAWGLDPNHDTETGIPPERANEQQHPHRRRPQGAGARDSAGDDEPVRRHGRAAGDAGRQASSRRPRRPTRRRRSRASIRRGATSWRTAPSRSAAPRPTLAASSPASKCRSTAARRGIRPTGRRGGATDSRPRLHRRRQRSSAARSTTAGTWKALTESGSRGQESGGTSRISLGKKYSS